MAGATISCAALLTGPCAFAQRLDLDGPVSPELGDLSVLAELGARLGRERDEAWARADAATDPALKAGLRLRGAVRDLAGALLELGAEHARFGAIGALDGLRMTDALGPLDSIASQAADAALAGHRAVRDGGADADAIASWERTRAAVEALTRRCEALAGQFRRGASEIKTESDLDHAVAHALSELRLLVPAGAQIDPAWPPRDPVKWDGSVDSAATIVAGMTLDGGLAGAAATAFDALRAGEIAPEVRRARRATAWRIVDAVRAADELARAQVSPPVTLGLASACATIADPARREVAESRIEAIAALGTLCEKTLELEADGVNVIGVREAMGVIAISLALPIDEKTQPDAQVSLVMAAITRMVDEAQRAPRGAALDFRDGKFNRAWRALVKRHEGIEQRAFEVAARLARSPGVLGTPEAATTMTALTDSTATLIRIVALSDWIVELRSGPNTGTIGPTRAGAADRLTVIRKGIGYDEHRDGALAALAEWETMRLLVLQMPAERRLRDGDPLLNTATRSRGPAVVRVMDLVRAAWLSAWARADEIALIDAKGRVDLVRRLGVALELCGGLREPDLAPRLSRWAPVRITPEALEEIRGRAEAVIAEAVGAAIDAQYDRLAGLLAEWDAACSAARAIAAMGAVSASRPDWPNTDGSAELIAQVCAPPPADAWLLDRRSELAAMSVWLAELDGATARGDRGMADAIVVWINHLAESVVQKIERGAR